MRFDAESQIKGYHEYMNAWTPEICEILKTCLEPETVNDRFAVAVENKAQILGHLKANEIQVVLWRQYSGSFVLNMEIHFKWKVEEKGST